MTIAGLPGVPGGAAMVSALDMFTADCLLDFKQAEIAGAPPEETVGFFFYEHEEPIFDGSDQIEWAGGISWVRLDNVHPKPQENFSINSTEVMMHLQREIESLKQICLQHADEHVPAEDLFKAAYSPFVGIGHSHPGGTVEVSAADYRCSESASAWRSATAPGAILGTPDDAKFFEADFLFAIENSGGEGTLVHFKRGSTRGTWKGNFLDGR